MVGVLNEARGGGGGGGGGGREGAGQDSGSGSSASRVGMRGEGTAVMEERRGQEEDGDEGPVVVVSGDNGGRGVGGQDSEGEESLVMDTSGDSDMEGVGWVARGESETEGFSDGVVDRDRVVRRRGGGGGGGGGGRKQGQENSVWLGKRDEEDKE